MEPDTCRKDVTMNAGRVETGLTAVDAYSQTTGCLWWYRLLGQLLGMDFIHRCKMDNTSSKGGSGDSERDDCRSEKSDVVRIGTQGYTNVGFRVVRTDFI